MSLESGTKLGPYEIVAPIGAGGMGEVYEAKDTRLDRRVAIKVLPDHLSDSDELRQRFEQEARAVSSLNHPHICTLHDVGRENGIDFIVMELIEGETLADRLQRGALAVEQAIEYARQTADALDEAHRHGIVHRDLKPGNIFVTKGGVKLLDFGLARLRQGVGGAGADDSAPTEAKPLTQEGAIVGTLQYMAPEQLEGENVDARTDLFAFGAVLYEMVTGRKAFQGQSQASLIGAILHTDPPAVSELRPMAPSSLDRLVRKCLHKDPDERWQTARDLKDELRWITESGGRREGATAPAGRRVSKMLIAALAGAIVAGLTVWLFTRRPSARTEIVTRSVIELPEGASLPAGNGPNIALSSDGTLLAVRARPAYQGPLFVRPLNELEATRVGDALADNRLLLTPDSQWAVTARSDGTLRKTSVRDGTDVIAARGVLATPFDWGPDGRIVATGGERNLVLFPAEGQAPVPLTTLDATKGEVLHSFPQFIPGHRVLFTILVGEDRFEDTRIAVVTPESAAIRVIQEGGTFARYAPTGGAGAPGHLLFVRPGV